MSAVLPLTGSELVTIYPNPVNGNYEATPEGFPVQTVEIVTTRDIAAISGGGSGIIHENIINSGDTNAETRTNVFIGWNSATAAAKSQTIPASTGSLAQMVIADLAGTAYDYPITVAPASGVPILGEAQVYTNKGSITLIDTSQGWVSV